MREIDQIYEQFRVIRDVFWGLSKRHDGIISRLIVYEDLYREFGMGPSDDIRAKLTACHSTILKEGSVSFKTEQEIADIKRQNPKARFRSNSAGDEVYYLEPALLSSIIFNCPQDDCPSQQEFDRLAADAGFLLVNLLNIEAYELNLPQILPIGILSKNTVTDGGTRRPTNLTERWLLFLHVLGWQRSPLCPLRARRFLWTKDNCQFHGDPEEIHKMFSGDQLGEMLKEISFPPHYFGSDLIQCVNLASVYAIDTILSRRHCLPNINVKQYNTMFRDMKPGKKDAYRYQDLISKVLELLFHPQLQNPQIEQRMDGDQSRIDICFDNCAGSGYFYDLSFLHRLKSPYAFFECKNYSRGIGSDEFNQIISRLDEKTTQVGFVVCRKITNWKQIEKRCNTQFLKKGVHIVVLDDNDILQMLRLKSENKNTELDKYLKEKLRKVTLGG